VNKEYPLTPNECYPPSSYDSTTRPPFIPNNDAEDKFANLAKLEKQLKQYKKYDFIARIAFALFVFCVKFALKEYNLLQYETYVTIVEILIIAVVILYFHNKQSKIREQVDSWTNF
jgi:hypothetical protein